MPRFSSRQLVAADRQPLNLTVLGWALPPFGCVLRNFVFTGWRDDHSSGAIGSPRIIELSPAGDTSLPRARCCGRVEVKRFGKPLGFAEAPEERTIDYDEEALHHFERNI